MRLTGIGHAGVHIDTGAGTILADPWVNPAFFASWFPFPDNSALPWDRLGDCDYLYVSHLHHDHFDPALLREHVSKDATVLLPDYTSDELRGEFEDLGFTRFVARPSGEVVELPGELRVMIQALDSPHDGPVGDSMLWVEHDGVRVLNQNDARPADLSIVRELGHVHAHLLQFSGAIWYPMVYELPERAKQVFGRRKRNRQFDRAVRYVRDLKADWVLPNAGPPCFLDDDLWHLNDLDDDEANIFPDQQVFADYLASRGHRNSALLLPGTVTEVSDEDCRVTQPVADVRRYFADKVDHLRAYRDRRRGAIAAEKATWRHPEIDVFDALRERLEPLLAHADHLARGVGGPVRFDITDEDGVEPVVVDFVSREVRRHAGERARYRFSVARDLIAHLLDTGEVDWENSLFLSCRFTASRVGPYNEHLYTFFRCLSKNRLVFAEDWYANHSVDDENIALGDWIVQRSCPHLGADLHRFGVLDGQTLTCQQHGWQFDLSTGRCLTATGYSIRSRKHDDR